MRSPRRGLVLDRGPLSRRLFLTGVAAGAATLGLTACGESAGPVAEAPQAGGPAGFPVTIRGKEGTVTIPAPPERVVAVGLQRDAETALALGVTPVAMPDNPSAPEQILPWTEAALTGTRPELLNTQDGLPYERIAALRPDLILATDNHELADGYDQLSRIAPTVSYLEGANRDTWQQRAEVLGTALGRSAQAREVIAGTEQQIRQTAANHPGFAGRTVSLSNSYAGEIYTVLAGDASVTFLEQLGMRLAPAVAALQASSVPGRALVAQENLDVLDADVVVVTAQTEQDRRFFESSALFPRLTAVRNGTYIPMDFLVAVAMAFPSPLSIPYALDTMVPAVAEVLAG